MNIKLAAVGGIAALLVLTGCSNESDNDEAATETTSASPSPSESESESEAPAEEPGTIVEVAAGNPDFETLVAAVTAADLAETLSGDGPFTVFAPTDDAFEALPDGLLDALLLPENKEALTSILTYHVLPAEVMAADVTAGEVATVEGSMIDITTDDGVMVNDATVITTDVEASNGVIHAIDAVLVPPSVDVDALLS
jgi:uncharacterized surface protein with fasciclin (FAS1) repeats